MLAWGGDGTINEVASALAFDDVPLGIVPAGSGNGLARELGVHPRAERAIAEALQAVPRPMDLGEIDGHLFANMAGIGFDAHIASRFATATRRGFIGYAGITARALTSYVPQHYRVTIGGVETAHRAVLVTIANSAQFGNNARIAPGARVDDGELDLVVFEERSRIATLCQMPRLFNGTVARVRGCTIRRIREATIESDQSMTYHVDGEPVAGEHDCGRAHPGALMVAVRYPDDPRHGWPQHLRFSDRASSPGGRLSTLTTPMAPLASPAKFAMFTPGWRRRLANHAGLIVAGQDQHRPTGGASNDAVNLRPAWAVRSNVPSTQRSPASASAGSRRGCEMPELSFAIPRCRCRARATDRASRSRRRSTESAATCRRPRWRPARRRRGFDQRPVVATPSASIRAAPSARRAQLVRGGSRAAAW